MNGSQEERLSEVEAPEREPGGAAGNLMVRYYAQEAFFAGRGSNDERALAEFCEWFDGSHPTPQAAEPRAVELGDERLRVCLTCQYVGEFHTHTDDVPEVCPQCDKAWALFSQAGEGEALRLLADGWEPDAWCHPRDNPRRRWVLIFDDPVRGRAVFYDEAEAREAYEDASASWTCHLLTSVPRARRY